MDLNFVISNAATNESRMQISNVDEKNEVDERHVLSVIKSSLQQAFSVFDVRADAEKYQGNNINDLII
jgi:hypothetical protein